jgi:hypothetical protein
MMALIRFVGGALALFALIGTAAAQECAEGFFDGERDATHEGVPYYWLFHILRDVARVTGVAAVNGYGTSSRAETIFEIARSDAAARAGKTYKSAIVIHYFPEAPQPRTLKAKLEIGGTAKEFAVEEKVKNASTGTIDLAPLSPALIGAIRSGELAHLTIFDGDKKFIEQYFRGGSMKTKLAWTDAAMDEIFAKADAGNCPSAPAPAPGGGAGPIL